MVGNTYLALYHIATPGTSTVKYKTPLPCIGLSGNYCRIYINFEFCEGKNHKHLENTMIYKAKQIISTNFFSSKKQSLHILEDGASSMQVHMFSM